MASRLYQRVPTNQCAKCLKSFQPGDRVTMFFIVHSAGKNPNNPRELGATLGEEFELGHVDCTNPQLAAAVLIGG